MERSHINILRSALIVKEKQATLEQGYVVYDHVQEKILRQLNSWILYSRILYWISYTLLDQMYYQPYQGDTIYFHHKRDCLLIHIAKSSSDIQGELWYSYVYNRSDIARMYLEERWNQEKKLSPCPHVYYICDTLEYYRSLIDEYFLWRDVLIEHFSRSHDLLINEYQEKVNELSWTLDILKQDLTSMVQNTQTTIEEISELQTLYKRTLDSMHLYVDIINLLSSKVE